MSSTPTTTLVPEDAAVSDSITPRSNCTVSVTPDGAHPVKAPSGIARAEEVPTVQRVSHPFDAAADKASRAIRVFPTPSAPQTRMPGTSEAEMAASMVRISSERPINGQDKRTYKSLRAPLAPRGDNGDFAGLTDAAQWPLMTLWTCLRRPSVAVSMPPFIVRLRMKPGIGTDRSIAMSNFTRVLPPSGVSVYPASWAFS